MDLREITEKDEYDKHVTHVIQSWQWGEFRKSLGLPLLRFGIYENDKLVTAFQLTLHKIPFTNFNVGYLPKGPFPDKKLKTALEIIGKKHNCAFIKIEPDIEASSVKGQGLSIDNKFKTSPKPLFTKYNFVLDLTPSLDELLKNMHQTTRYNIRLAEKKGVKVEIREDDEAFNIYLDLYFETTKRQNYHGHNREYHAQVWETLKKEKTAKIAIAFFESEPLTAWMLLNFKDTLYYPYGGSLPKHRELMHSNLVAWEAIKYGKKLNLKYFDMWGALGPNADPKDPWYGFHRFKQGYGARHVEYLGTFDLIFNYPIYLLFTFIDKLTPLKLFLLKLLEKLQISQLSLRGTK